MSTIINEFGTFSDAFAATMACLVGPAIEQGADGSWEKEDVSAFVAQGHVDPATLLAMGCVDAEDLATGYAGELFEAFQGILAKNS